MQRSARNGALMAIWNFCQDDTRLRRWTRTDDAEVRTDSEKEFKSRKECILDAIKHGYRARPPEPNGWAFSVRHDE